MNRCVKILTFLFILFFVLFQSNVYSQNHHEQSNINYASYHQNMWGPSWQPFTLDFDYELFNVHWDTTWSWSQMTNILGDSIGISLEAGTWGVIASHFSMHGFTTGFVNVKYPVHIDLTFPDNHTFNPGQIVTINSQYNVLPGWWLDTHYPSVGTVTLDMDFGLGANIDLITCAFGCDTFHLIPPINIPTDSITIFHIDSTGSVVYPVYNPNVFPPFEFVHDSVLPVIINDWFNIGLTGEITLPYVITTDTLMPDQCLYASGDSTYLHLNLNIITFLHAVAGLIPPPQGPAIQQALDYLNGSTDIPIGSSTATITWSIIQASFYISSTQEQDFTFCPTIWANLSFPTALNYTVTDPSIGDSLLSQGTNSLIKFAVNNDLNIQYPCHGYDTLPIGIEYTFTNDFTNHTWDSIAFGFQFSALTFSFHLPTFFIVVPPAEIPAFYLPNVDSSNTSITERIFMPGYTSDGVEPPAAVEDIQDFDWNIGPLFQDSIALGYIPFTWYNNTWNLEGFTPIDTVMPSTFIVPNEELSSTIAGNNVVCYGDSTGTISVIASFGIPPYTFTYSNGVVNTHLLPVDNILAAAGTISVTVTDGYGCTSINQINIINLHPPINIQLTSTSVLCYGDSTGTINSIASGGVPGYTYLWSPSGQIINNPINLPGGMYTVTITDAIGCKKSDSILVVQPASPLNLSTSIHNISCYGGNDGAIDITVAGGTVPYSYNWSNGLHTQDIANLYVGTYILTVTDGHSCLDTISSTLPGRTEIQIQVLPHDVSCFHLTDGSIDITVSGGTPPYSYGWNNLASSEDIFNLTSGSFSVTVTDSLLCIKTASTTITEPLQPLTPSFTSNHVKCFSGNDGNIDVTVFGGTAPYTYLWSNNEITQDVNTLIAGTYTVTIKDAHLCNSVMTIVITQPASALQASITGNDVSCFEGHDGTLNLTVSGGTPSYLLAWNNGFSDYQISNLPQGDYTVTVTDFNLCVTLASFTIKEPAEIHLMVSPEQHICYGQTDTIAVINADGGTPPFQYFWNNGMTESEIAVAPNHTTGYSVHIIDSKGCISYSMTVQVNVDPELKVNITAEKDTVCPNEAAILHAQITGGGGSPYTVHIGDSIMGTPPLTVFINQTSLLYAYVYDRCMFKKVYDTILIHTYPLPPVNISHDQASGCQPFTVHFNESSLNIGQSYYWNFDDGDFENLSFDKNPVHTFHNAVVYHVKLMVTSKQGCKNYSDTSIITVFKKPDARFAFNPQKVTLTNSMVQFTNLSSDFITHQWTFGDGLSSNDLNPEHAFSDFGVFKVELFTRSDHECTDTTSANIKVESDFTFYAPTAFSPDRDSHNDQFKVFTYGILPGSYNLIIYDRWGELIFETINPDEGWNGKVNSKGDLCNPGVYTWLAIFKDHFGNSMQKVGTVTLIR